MVMITVIELVLVLVIVVVVVVVVMIMIFVIIVITSIILTSIQIITIASRAAALVQRRAPRLQPPRRPLLLLCFVVVCHVICLWFLYVYCLYLFAPSPPPSRAPRRILSKQRRTLQMGIG